jgi:hypothetical protein
VLNVHAPTEDTIDDMNGRFSEELEQVFNKLPKYYMKMLIGDFNSKVGRENYFKPTIGNDSSHEISNANGVRVVNSATQKILLAKVRCFHIVTFTNLLGRLLMERRTIKLTTF